MKSLHEITVEKQDDDIVLSQSDGRGSMNYISITMYQTKILCDMIMEVAEEDGEKESDGA